MHKSLRICLIMTSLLLTVQAGASAVCDKNAKKPAGKSANDLIADKFLSDDMKHNQGNLMNLKVLRQATIEGAEVVQLIGGAAYSTRGSEIIRGAGADAKVVASLNERLGQIKSLTEDPHQPGHLIVLTTEGLFRINPENGKIDLLPLNVKSLGIEIVRKGHEGLFAADSKSNILQISQDFLQVNKLFEGPKTVKDLYVKLPYAFVASEMEGGHVPQSFIFLYDITAPKTKWSPTEEILRPLSTAQTIFDFRSFHYESGILLVGTRGGVKAYILSGKSGEPPYIYRESLLIGELGNSEILAIETRGPELRTIEKQIGGSKKTEFRSYQLQDITDSERWWLKER